MKINIKKIIGVFLTILSCSACSNIESVSEKENESSSSLVEEVEENNMLYGVCYIISERYKFEENMDKDIQLLENLGVNSIRLWTNFNQYLKNSTTIDQENCQQLHKFISKLKEIKITPILMNYVSYDHGKNILSKKYLRDIEKNSDYVSWLTEYYMSWKTLAKEFAEVTYFEVGNEINNGDFMKNMDGSAMSDMQDMASISADMLYHASRGIKTVNKNAKIVMGGLTETRKLGSGENVDFLNKIYDCINSGQYGYMYKFESIEKASKNPDDYFDIVAWHPYFHGEKLTKEEFISRNQKMYDVVLKNEPEGKDVFFTEIGFTDNNQTYEENKESLTLLYDAIKEMPYVKAINYFKLFDSAKISWVGNYSRWGLIFDPDPANKYDEVVSPSKDIPINGKAKLIAYEFQRLSNGKGNLDILEVKDEKD